MELWLSLLVYFILTVYFVLPSPCSAGVSHYPLTCWEKLKISNPLYSLKELRCLFSTLRWIPITRRASRLVFKGWLGILANPPLLSILYAPKSQYVSYVLYLDFFKAHLLSMNLSLLWRNTHPHVGPTCGACGRVLFFIVANFVYKCLPLYDNLHFNY